MQSMKSRSEQLPQLPQLPGHLINHPSSFDVWDEIQISQLEAEMGQSSQSEDRYVSFLGTLDSLRLSQGLSVTVICRQDQRIARPSQRGSWNNKGWPIRGCTSPSSRLRHVNICRLHRTAPGHVLLFSVHCEHWGDSVHCEHWRRSCLVNLSLACGGRMCREIRAC